MPEAQYPTLGTFPLNVQPGVKRDGTPFEGNNWNEGIWTRFTRLGKPISMPGYRRITADLSGPARALHAKSVNGFTVVHSGHKNGNQMLQVANSDGSLASGITDRTPAGFVSDPNNLWTFDSIYDSFGTAQMVLGVATPDALTIDSDAARKLWLGPYSALTALVDSTAPQLSGGVCVFHPYVFVFGSDGRVDWCDPGLPSTWNPISTARICEAKIIRGMPMRGGSTNTPAGLFWSLNTLERCTFNPAGTPTFRFDTLSDDISVLGKKLIVEFDGVYYWLGQGRYQMYNGVVRELPNTMNLNDLFRRLNRPYGGRGFAYTVPAWSEIHFVVPVDGSTEPNWSFIYNVALQTWYDTPYQENGRGAHATSKVFPYPILSGVRDVGGSKYELWQHETESYNKVASIGPEAIRKSITTCDIGYMAEGPMNSGWAGVNRNTRTVRLEPDFNQVGNIAVSVIGRAFARSDAITRTQACTPTTKVLDDIRTQARLIHWKFESNCLDGMFEIGQPIVNAEPGDASPIQP